MSQLSDKIAEIQGHFDTLRDDVNAKIAELQALVASGGATPQDMAALQAFEDAEDALAAAINPPTTTPPTTEPPTTTPPTTEPPTTTPPTTEPPTPTPPSPEPPSIGG